MPGTLEVRTCARIILSKPFALYIGPQPMPKALARVARSRAVLVLLPASPSFLGGAAPSLRSLRFLQRYTPPDAPRARPTRSAPFPDTDASSPNGWRCRPAA